MAENWTGAETTCPFSQHSSPQSRYQALDVTALPAVPLLQPSSPGQRRSSCGRSRGAPPLDSPMHVALSLPSSQEPVVSLLPIHYDCICADTTTPPWGEGRVQGPACSTFSILELYQINHFCLFSFSLLAFLTAFFHTCLLCSLKLSSWGSLLESTRI